MRAQVVAALRAVLVFTVLCGVAYPLAVTAFAQLAFDDRADGSLLHQDGRVVGSSLLGQELEGPEWFAPRPSAAGDGYDTAASGASNLGPSNPALLDEVESRVADYRRANDLAADAPVPVDAVTASGSGLDPHISVANARLQAPRVAEARDLPVDTVLDLIDQHTTRPWSKVLGETAVNVVELNLAVADAR